MTKTYLNPKNSAFIMGAYSHGIKVDIGDSQMIFVTGQMGMDKNGKAVAPGNFKKQTEYAFKNIQNILKSAGATLNDVVKAVIYTTDVSRFKEISAVRNKYFKASKPVSTMVQVSKLSKDGCDIEIDVIAIKSAK